MSQNDTENWVRMGWIILSGGRGLKFQRDGGAFGFLGLDLNTSLVQFHDLQGEAEPDSGALFFGGEERHKNLVKVFLRDAPSIVCYPDDNTPIQTPAGR